MYSKPSVKSIKGVKNWFKLNVKTKQKKKKKTDLSFLRNVHSSLVIREADESTRHFRLETKRLSLKSCACGDREVKGETASALRSHES